VGCVDTCSGHLGLSCSELMPVWLMVIRSTGGLSWFAEILPERTDVAKNSANVIHFSPYKVCITFAPHTQNNAE